MAQTIQMTSVNLSTSMAKKTYSVNLKGLLMHIVDVLFIEQPVSVHRVDSLSNYIQKDIGIYH